ncbi:MAG TPA: nitrous oxide reductase accessory protein NosL [Blastocatellia bacterium]|nr:nitrous oxide reductase accessory protein NosL [Blastocatellia bacterium]
MRKEKAGMKKGKERLQQFLSTYLFAFGLLALILLSASCSPNRNGPVAASAKFGYCPVCHMKVSSDDQWSGEIVYSDGSKLMFESPGDLLTFYQAPDKYDVKEIQKDHSAITRISVKDYQSHTPIDVREAALVYKSRVSGPMGPDFLPFGKREDAEAFVKANGGVVLNLSDVTPSMVQNLRPS